MQKMIDPDVECILIAAPDTALLLMDNDAELKNEIVICTFAPKGTAVLVRKEDWEKMIDNGDVYERPAHE